MGQFGKWVKMYCICQGWIWKSEFIPRLLLPQPLFRTQLKLTKDWGIRITTIHSNTKNIQPWFHIFLVSFFGANKGCVGALYWAKHQIFPIFLLSQYTQCDIFFFLGTQYIAQKIPISMQNATIWMGTFWEINDVFFIQVLKSFCPHVCAKKDFLLTLQELCECCSSVSLFIARSLWLLWMWTIVEHCECECEMY